MERWSSVLKIPLIATSSNYYRVAASLCLSEVPSANAVFFHGDRVRDTGNTVIERLYDLRKVAEVIVSKFGNSVNAWVVEASVFNGPFAVYKDFVPTVNRYGEPTTSYSPVGLPASSSIVSLLSSFLQEGGVVMNQFLSEMSSLDANSASEHEEIGTIPASKESFLNSVSEVHYIDVGLNSSGAYITDQNVVQRISQRLAGGGSSVSVFVHGTPRQWRDEQRGWILEEKDELVRLLKSEGENSGGKLQVHERFYFADRVPDLQMHFEIIDAMDVSSA
ncbi:hypothetical protein IGI04_017108 [Brassica rapa subsp. trilocularis]|uniref:Uncharacterized protein n=1 Tax=Brassica rapa subsp. trilocularis TaxID=1813537 RepID=A0ABQ7MXG5_BRACM|nr:hypothetical protein IGI04_017108 [Brassica rapa subsp. trilocularis]